MITGNAKILVRHACPFCGQAGANLRTKSSWQKSCVHVCCSDCGVLGPAARTKVTAIELWNKAHRINDAR